ncbi:MAG: LacI family DNA-binding transcriptional regulator [Flexilinea sp.]
MATIREIAKLANVSIATVSKVLNGKSGVSSKTHDLILSIAKDLDYRPNLNARNLKKGQSRTIGIITEDLTVFNTPEIIDGIDAYCDTCGYQFIIGNLRYFKRYGHRNPDNPESILLADALYDTMLSKQVDGIVYVGCHSHAVSPPLIAGKVPIVFAYCYCADASIPSVGYDDRKAGYEAAKLLLADGHRKIGVIAGPVDSIHTSNRLAGFQEAFYEYNIPYNPALTMYGDWERDRGYEIAENLVSAGVTAVFAQNDLMAIGLIDYCSKHGLKVGRDIALVGFDNREIASVSRPALTTVSLPLFEIGETSARILINIINGTEYQIPVKTLLDCSIIIRESSNFIPNNISANS